MRIAYLQVALSIFELNQLIKEFPQILFLSFPKPASSLITQEHWSKIEILFGRRLLCDELKIAEQLRWVHCPIPEVNALCISEIDKRGNVLVTNTLESNNFQIAEFVLAAILAFSKNLFSWKDVNRFPQLVWDCKWRSNMWTLKNKVFLQIGTGPAALQIAKKMAENGMKVWGMNERATFFPYANKSLGTNQLEKYLPQADIVSVFLPPQKKYDKWLGEKELKLMKDDSILIVLGSNKCIDENALADIATAKKWKGILFDVDYQFPLSSNSKLWNIPNIIITPEIAPRPKDPNNDAFKTFRYNLRHYIRGNFSEMKNVIDPSILYGLQEESD